MLRFLVRMGNNRRNIESDLVRRTEQFINGVASNGAILSRTKAPIAYGTLVNSQFINVSKRGNDIHGEVGYNVSYAEHLETGSWAPKPPPKYGDNGTPANAWNPQATPGFLVYGFESPEAVANIERLKAIFGV